MGRNNADFNSGKDMPGFEGTMGAFNSLIKKGEAIVEKRKEPAKHDASKYDSRLNPSDTCKDCGEPAKYFTWTDGPSCTEGGC